MTLHPSVAPDAFMPLMNEQALTSLYHLVRYHRRGYMGRLTRRGRFDATRGQMDELVTAADRPTDLRTGDSCQSAA
ncbi:MAG: hypothetical protein ACM3VT_06865, partial [Solirubrobacterales bacterium]